MAIDFNDRNIAPVVVRPQTNISIANGTPINFNIGAIIAGGLADSIHNPSFTAIIPPSLSFNPGLGDVSGSLVDDSVYSFTIGVSNDLGPSVTESFQVTVGTPTVELPGPAAPEGQVRIGEDSGDLVFSFAITPITGSHTSRQVQRRTWASANTPEQNWSDVGSQALADVDYTDVAPANNTPYEYRVVDTVDSVDYPSRTIVGFVSSSAPTLTDNGSNVTWVHGPFTAVVDKTSYGLTATLNGSQFISGIEYSATVDRSINPTTVVNPTPTTVTVGSEASKPYHVDLYHQDATKDIQHWTDIEFFPNTPLISAFPLLRTWYTDNPNNHYSAIYDSLIIKDEVFEFKSSVIQDPQASWLQASPLDGRNESSGVEARMGISSYGYLDGGRWIECIGASPRSFYIRGDDAKPDYIDYIFQNPVNVDAFVMDFELPTDDPDFYNVLGQMDWEAYDSSDNLISSGKAADQSSVNQSLPITGALSNVKYLRLTSDQSPYGKRAIVGRLRGIVSSQTVYQIDLDALAPSEAECYPLGFSVERIKRQSPVRVEVTSTGVRRTSRPVIPYLRDLISNIPGCGATAPVAVSAGTGGADQAFDAPVAHTGQSAKIPSVIFPELTGQSAKTAEVWDYCESKFYLSYQRETWNANSSGDGDTLVGGMQITSPELHLFTSHRQAGTQNVAVNLLRRNWTQENWDLAISGIHFSMRAMCADYGPRSKYLGALGRKSEVNPFNYFQSEPQLGYQHQAIAFLLMYEYTGRKMYLDHARITIDGGTYNLYRDTEPTVADPGYYMHSWTRTNAMMYQCAILGYENFGDIHPVYDGNAPTNTNGNPENPVPAGKTYLDLIKDRMDIELGAIIATASPRKYYGAAQYTTSQPVWATWSMSMLCWYYGRMVADGDTTRAAQALQVIQGTAEKYMDDFIQGTGSSTQFAYVTNPGSNPNDPIDVTSWTPSYATSSYVSFFMEVLALGYEVDFSVNGITTLNTNLKAKVLQLWNDFKDEYSSGSINHRKSAGMLHGLPNATRIFPGELI